VPSWFALAPGLSMLAMLALVQVIWLEIREAIGKHGTSWKIHREHHRNGRDGAIASCSL